MPNKKKDKVRYRLLKELDNLQQYEGELCDEEGTYPKPDKITLVEKKEVKKLILDIFNQYEL